jgi:MraZ protein
MFRGANKLTLDSKGRMVMPTRYRDRLQERCGGRLGHHGRQRPVPADLPAAGLGGNRAQIDGFAELRSAGPALAAPHGRARDGFGTRRARPLLLPPNLREFGLLTRDAMLIGQGHRFELWDEARWNERRDEWLANEDSATDLPADLEKLSL